MSDAEAVQVFTWSLVAAGAVVLVAASLLLVIWRTAVAIESLAGEALGTARRIVDNTAPIWELHAVRNTTEGILDSCESIAARGAALSGALSAHEGGAEPRRSRGPQTPPRPSGPASPPERGGR